METLDKHFRHLTQGIFQKHGFAQQELLNRWADIAGTAAAHCRPERIKWPRAAAAQGGSGGILMLVAYAGRALDVQHAAHGIMDRINQFLGYQAISAVKVTQGHELPPVATPAYPAPASSPSMPPVEGVKDPALREALQRLALGVSAQARRSPQPK